MSIGLVALSLGTHHVPSPGPAELGTTAAIVAMVIGITLTAVHSVQKTPRRAIGQAGLAFVLGACAGIAIADGINALVVWGDDTTTAIGYTMATAAGVVGAVATYLVGRRAGILGSATA